MTDLLVRSLVGIAVGVALICLGILLDPLTLLDRFSPRRI